MSTEYRFKQVPPNKTAKISPNRSGVFMEHFSPSLNNQVKSIFYLELDMNTEIAIMRNQMLGRSNYERVLPTGFVELVIFSEPSIVLKDESSKNDRFLPACTLTSLMTKHKEVLQVRPIRMFGVRFFPSSANGFTSQFGSLDLDQVFDANDFIREIIGIPSQDLFELPVNDSFTLLENKIRQFFDQHSNDVKNISHDAVNYILSLSGQLNSMETLFSRYALTSRRIEQLFRNDVGVCPKYYCRIVQFINSMKRLLTSDQERLIDLVYDCGYYDQAHFIRNFKEFSGTTPKKYTREDNRISSLLNS